MLVPLADCLNHNNATYINPDLLEPNLHKARSKNYLYKHNFDKEVKKHYSEDDLYDKSNSRLRINCSKLFSEDEQNQVNTIDQEEERSRLVINENSIDNTVNESQVV